jgi:hypothetical protein
MAGSLVGWMQAGFHHLSGNNAASFIGAPRVPDTPWMALIGVVAAPDLDKNGAQRAYQPFLIGKTREQHVVERSGYFYAYANDAWGFYDNNKGSVTLKITRLD